jgi:Lon protease-like protein
VLPRGQMPLNIFEPRYLAMVTMLRDGHRLIGMIQPDVSHRRTSLALFRVGCVGRITQAEAGDGRIRAHRHRALQGC